MEVVEYLKGAGRRRWILLVLPIALVILALPWALSQPQQFRTVSTVSVQPSTGYQGPSAIRSFVDTFVQVSESDAVLQRASAESGVPVSDFRSSLSVTPVGGSPLVEVEVNTLDRDKGEDVTGAVIRAALAIPLDSAIAQSEVEVEAVQADVQEVEDQLAALERKSGELLPSEAYRLAVANVVRIENALAGAGSGADGDAVSEADLAEAQQVLRETRKAAQEYQALQIQVSQKLNQVTIVEARLSQFEERKEQIDGAVFESTTKPVSNRPLMIQAVVAAVLAGLLLASAGLVAVERWRRRKPGSEPDPARGAAAPIPAERPSGRDRELEGPKTKAREPVVARDRPSSDVGAEKPVLRKARPWDQVRAMGSGRER